MRLCHCPGCAAQIQLDTRRDFGFCPYCGSKIMLDDYRSTHHVVDEAKVQEAETDRLIRLKELEIKEKEMERNRKSRFLAYKIAGGLAGVGILWNLVAPDSEIAFGAIMVGIIIAMCAYTSGEKNKDNVDK